MGGQASATMLCAVLDYTQSVHGSSSEPFVAKGTAVVVKAIAELICKSQTLQMWCKSKDSYIALQVRYIDAPRTDYLETRIWLCVRLVLTSKNVHAWMKMFVSMLQTKGMQMRKMSPRFSQTYVLQKKTGLQGCSPISRCLLTAVICL